MEHIEKGADRNISFIQILSRTGVGYPLDDMNKIAGQSYGGFVHSNSIAKEFSLRLHEIVSIRLPSRRFNIKWKIWEDTGHLPRKTLPWCTHYMILMQSYTYNHGDVS